MINQLKDSQVETWNRTGSRIYIKSLALIEDDTVLKCRKYDFFSNTHTRLIAYLHGYES